ncbi:MAG: sulfotransferase [Rhodanobacteraceae bacterium]
MKLQVPFVQLPVQFDAERLAAEMYALGDEAWRPHPQKFPGNFALPLISVNGDPESDSIAGPMRPTEYLNRCPYLKQTLAHIGAVWGRTRLMKLTGQAEVSKHADTNYYWRERVRVHVPVVTRPAVRFLCGDAEVNMAPGECWIFDTWREHRVINAQNDERVHLVADTVGSDAFWERVGRGRALGQNNSAWRADLVQPDESISPLLLESVNVPRVMSPWELREHIGFLLRELRPHPQQQQFLQSATRFFMAWQALWAEFGDSEAGWPAYRSELDEFATAIRSHAETMQLVNGTLLFKTLQTMVLGVALADRRSIPQATEERQAAPGLHTVTKDTDAEFYRPIFIVSSPRSGSTVLFETLARAPRLYTIGGESHALIEGVPGLRMAMQGFGSNRLDAAAASPGVVAELRHRFLAKLHDRDGNPPSRLPLRMLEKTPKNALRVLFLAQAFPEARFVYLYRDPREILASMIEAWQSGRFCTYPLLPGWQGLPWSLLLVPDWRELIGKPLHEIVAAQWRTTTRILLDDLAALPAERHCVIRYDNFVADPQTEISALCTALGLEWDQSLQGELPASRYTVTAPSAQKWRRHQREIEAVLPGLQTEIERAERMAGAGRVAPTASVA